MCVSCPYKEKKAINFHSNYFTSRPILPGFFFGSVVISEEIFLKTMLETEILTSLIQPTLSALLCHATNVLN